MLRIATTFGITLFAVPIVGIALAMSLARDGSQALRVSSISAAHVLCVAEGEDVSDTVENGCELISSGPLIELGFLATAGVMALLLAGYVIGARTLAHPRDRLARYFPIIIRASLVTLVLVLLSQGILVFWLLYELPIAQGPQVASSWWEMVVWILIFVGAGLIAAASLIAWSWRELLTVAPLEVTGLVVSREQLPDLWARIDRLATKLRAEPPKQLILGLEPTAFVAAAKITLRGFGSLPLAETLYLPMCGLRIWTDAELDAVIGHELGHFRGEDLRYSARFIPVFRSLAVSLQSVQMDERVSVGWFRAARIPAVLVLTTMLDLLHGIVSKVSRERELAADQAAASVSSGTALLSALGKISAISAEWPDFWGALAHFITFGRTRVNFCDDLLLRAAALRALIAPQRFARWLLESRQPHPFDSHPSIAARAAALGIDAGPIVEASVAPLDDRSEGSPELRALEEVLTKEITERIRIPGAALHVDSTPGLPDELARRKPQPSRASGKG